MVERGYPITEEINYDIEEKINELRNKIDELYRMVKSGGDNDEYIKLGIAFALSLLVFFLILYIMRNHGRKQV